MKASYLPFVLMFLYNATAAQAPNWQWAKQSGQARINALGRSICTDANRNVYVAGTYSGTFIAFGQDTITNSTNNVGQCGFIVKYNATGNVIWVKGQVYVGTKVGICADNFGHVYVTGSFYKPTVVFDNDTLFNAGFINTFITKYDTLGNVIWARSVRGDGSDEGSGISADASGNIYITGDFTSSADTFGNIILAHPGGSNDIFVAKYDSSGNAIWASGAGGANSDYGIAISADATGNAYVTGFYQSPDIAIGAYFLTNTGFENLFVARFDPNGNPVWAKNAGGSETVGQGISADAYGGVCLLGNFSGDTIFLGNDTIPGAKNALAKYDSSGSLLWVKGIEATGEGVSTDVNGNIYATGFFNTPLLVIGNDTLTETNQGNIFVVKYDASGNFIWAQNAGGTEDVLPYGLCNDDYGNVIATGVFTSGAPVFANDTLYDSLGFDEAFIVKLGNATVTRTSGSFCSGSTFNFNGRPLDTAGVYTDTLTGVHGDDSLIVLNLLEYYPVYDTLSANICAGNSYPFNDSNLTASGFYNEVLTARTGCDSIVTLNLIVSGPFTTAISDSICPGNNYQFGNLSLSTAGVYKDTLNSAGGCDSIVVLSLTVNALPNPVITRDSNTLSTQIFTSYQWLKNGLSIANATNQTYQVTADGAYSVIVTDGNGCIDTSAVINVVKTLVSDLTNALDIKIFPNPNKGSFLVQSSDNVSREMEITDALGRVIMPRQSITGQKQISLDNIAPGIYLMQVEGSNQAAGFRFAVIR